MTKQEVIGAIGPPESASAGKGEETLFYVEERPWWQWARIRVHLVEGKVTEFGEVPKWIHWGRLPSLVCVRPHQAAWSVGHLTARHGV